MAELDLLDRAGVPADAFIWVHAHSERDATFHTRAAKAGRLGRVRRRLRARSVDAPRRAGAQMKAEGLLGRVLVSHDAGWFHVGEPDGGQFRPFDTLFTKFIPALTSAGLTKEEVRQLIVENPRRALTREAGRVGIRGPGPGDPRPRLTSH